MRYYWKRRLFWAFTVVSFLALHKVFLWHSQRRARLRHSREDSLHSTSPAVAAAAAALVDTPEVQADKPVPAATRIAGPPVIIMSPASKPASAPAPPQGPVAGQLPKEEVQDDDEDAPGGCEKPPKVASLTEAVQKPQVQLSLEASLPLRSLAWCHDGNGKNGAFQLLKDGRTGGDFPNWGLKRWRPKGIHTVTVDNGEGDNVHTLTFNCEHTAFKVKSGAQRGYVEGLGFESAESAGAPSNDEDAVCEAKRELAKWSPTPGKFPVWIMWDFQHGVPSGFRMNLRTWRRHIPQEKFDLQLVNQSNIKRYLPGIPESYFRLYPAAKADFMRASLLAVHGGVYLDGDILLSVDLDTIIKDVLEGKVDVMPYEGPGDHCPRSYTTNFMAGVRGNRLSSEWINTTMRKMRQRCKLDESQNHREPVPVCCHQSSWCLRKECHVKWGDISHPPALEQLPEGSVRLSCVPFKNGFSTTLAGDELFWKLADGPTDQRDNCWPDGGTGIKCTSPVGHLPNFFEKQGHHLYNMLKGFSLEKMSDEEILASNMVVGELYRRSLGLSR